MIKMDKIMLATDFSEQSKVAVPFAVDLAKRYGAQLHIINVFDETAMDPLFFTYAGTVDEFFKKIEEGFDAEINGLLADFNTESLTIVPVLANGTAFVEIVKYAKANGVDMIVLGTHGRTGLAHMLLGSTTEKVIRKAHCPVLAVRHPEFEFVPPA